MKSYVCARGHHFHAATPTCPTGGCTAEVRPTSVHPLHGRAPAFEKLPKLNAKPRFKPEPQSEEDKLHQHLVVQGKADPVKHSTRWWAYAEPQHERIRRNSTMHDADWNWDVTCSCGWDSRTGGATFTEIERKIAEHKA